MPPKKGSPAKSAAKSAPAAKAAAAPPPVDDDNLEDFDALVQEVIANPEKINDMTPEQLIELQNRLNPYGGIAGPPPDAEHKRVVACSYTNLREDYIARFLATSLVGFVFQIAKEWEVPVEQRRWTPADNTKKEEEGAPKAKAEAFQPWDPAKLIERLEATLAIAKEAQKAAAEAATARQAAAEASACLPGDVTPEVRARQARAAAIAESAAARAAGLLYAATHATHGAGRDAGARLHATADAGMRYAEVKGVLERYPLPRPPGEVEMPADRAKAMITGFLRHWFEFDPSVHVRSGHSGDKLRAAIAAVPIGAPSAPPTPVDTKDPGHLTLDAARAPPPTPTPAHLETVRTIRATPRGRDAVVALLRDPELREAALAACADVQSFLHYLCPVAEASAARPAADVVPPQDTFHRWGYYREVNYEELRTITEALYPERPDFDWALGAWAFFEGTPAEVDAAFAKHCQRYQDEVPSAVKAIELGGWTLLGDFKENRKKIEFYNKNTEVIKRILERHAEDKRIGKELMRKRVVANKARNIAEVGPDAPGLAAYKRAVAERGQGLAASGAERVISAEQMKRLEKAKGDLKAAQELELLEQYEKTIADLGDRAAGNGKPLSADERRDFEHARDNVGRAREMVAVPDNAIQVDVFTTDAAAGTFTKTHIYTAAETPEERNAAIAEAARVNPAAFTAMPAPGDHPVAAMHPPRPLAPYAVQHIVDSARDRSEAEMKAEAVRDHDRSANSGASTSSNSNK